MVVTQAVSAGQPMAAGIDQPLGARLATDLLLDQGHHHVAHVAGPADWVEAEQRRQGWRDAHTARGLVPGPELVGDWSARSGYEAGRLLAEDRDLTAVFVANDEMALGVLKALHEGGRHVPDEVSVVGFDDVPEAAYFWPGLTTIRQDFTELGTRAVDLALRALEGDPGPTTDLVVPEVVTRASAGPARAR